MSILTIAANAASLGGCSLLDETYVSDPNAVSASGGLALDENERHRAAAIGGAASPENLQVSLELDEELRRALHDVGTRVSRSQRQDNQQRHSRHGERPTRIVPAQHASSDAMDATPLPDHVSSIRGPGVRAQ
jgi:hypothetical protein